MERIQHLLAPAPHVPSAPLAGAATILALVLTTGLGLQAQSHDPAPLVAPAVPQGNRPGHTALYIHAHNLKDSEGKDIPYAAIFDIKADQVPLNQAWGQFLRMTKPRGPRVYGESWCPLDRKVAGPRVNLDLKDATLAEVLKVLGLLAQQKGVAPYEPPAPYELPEVTITKYALKDKSHVLDFHARQVSAAYLDHLMAEARRLMAAQDVDGGTMAYGRDDDHGRGPKLDALFEGVTLEELQAKVQRLKAEGR